MLFEQMPCCNMEYLRTFVCVLTVVCQHTVSPREPEEDSSMERADIKLILTDIAHTLLTFVTSSPLNVFLLALHIPPIPFSLCSTSTLLPSLTIIIHSPACCFLLFSLHLIQFAYFSLFFIFCSPFCSHSSPHSSSVTSLSFLSLSYMPTILPALSSLCKSSITTACAL